MGAKGGFLDDQSSLLSDGSRENLVNANLAASIETVGETDT
jgi:hypothetical protein